MELIVVAVFFSLILLSAAKVYREVTVGFSKARSKGTALEMARRHLNETRSVEYYRIPIALTPQNVPGYSDVQWDPMNFPPDSFTRGGTTFTRYTGIQIVQRSPGQENFVIVSATCASIGAKQITETVVWLENGDAKRVLIQEVIESSSFASRNIAVQGIVKSTDNIPLPGVAINVNFLQPSNVSDAITDVNGRYTLNCLSGTQAISARKFGFDTVFFPNQTFPDTDKIQTLNFSLARSSAMDTISGSVWFSDKPVISQVSGHVVDPVSMIEQEYVEIFNPTTWTWTVSGTIGLKFQRKLSQDPFPLPIEIDYISSEVSPRSYYLFSNVNSVIVGTVSRVADAVWDRSGGNPNFTNFAPRFMAPHFSIIPVSNEMPGVEGAGALELYQISSGQTLDQVGWNGAGQNPGFFETHPIDSGMSDGLENSEVFKRVASTNGFSYTLGPAYDSGDNSLDWVSELPVIQTPRNTTCPPPTIVSGIPAYGASVFTRAHMDNDPSPWNYMLPPVVTAIQEISGARPYAGFHILQAPRYVLAVEAFSNARDGGTTLSGAHFGVPILLEGTNPFIRLQGQITDFFGTPVPNAAVNQFSTDDLGRFDIATRPAALQKIFHYFDSRFFGGCFYSPSAPVGSTVSGTIATLLNQVKVRGAVVLQSSGQPVPGVRITISGKTGSNWPKSDHSGNFESWVETGTFTFAPYGIPNEEKSVPPSISLAVTPAGIGTDIFVGTFTIVRAEGSIEGTVNSAGQPLKDGALIVAIPLGTPQPSAGAPPPDLPSSTPVYSTVSGEDGHFKFDVPTSSTGTVYNVYAYKSDFVGNTSTTTRTDFPGIAVHLGGTTWLNVIW